LAGESFLENDSFSGILVLLSTKKAVGESW